MPHDSSLGGKGNECVQADSDAFLLGVKKEGQDGVLKCLLVLSVQKSITQGCVSSA